MYSSGFGYAPASGPPEAELAIIGEALGRQEALAGAPFIGPSGELLNRLLSKIGLDRRAVRVDNCVRCQPPNDWLDGAPWEYQALTTCRQYISQTLKENRRAVVALGGSATRQLLQLPRKGHKQANWHGSAVLEPGGQFYVIPSFHPAYLLRGNKRLSRVVCWDLKRALDVARGWDPRPAPTSLVVDPSPAWFADWASQITADCWLAVDIETQDKILGQDEDELSDDFNEIVRINFAYSTDQGVTVPWAGQYLQTIRRLLEHPGVQCYWNGSYDIPRLRAAGYAPTGRCLDFMWAWHVLQSDLPRGLGFVAPFYSDYGPWKHLSGSDPGLYAAVDAVQTLRCAFGIARDLQAGGQWRAFYRHVYELDTRVLHPAEDAGILVDSQGLAAYREELAGEKHALVTRAQELVPEELKPLGPSLAKRPDEPNIVERQEEVETQVCSACGAVGIAKTHRCKDRTLTPAVAKKLMPMPRYHRQLQFNLGSSDQLLTYIKARGHKPGRAKKTAGDSTDEQTLQRLAKQTKDQVYQLALDYRRVDKILGTYIGGTERRIGPDGRLHPTFTHAPSTMRLSCVNPNFQNIDKESKYRASLVAGPGKVFIEVDYSAIEAIQTGWYLGDPNFIRLAKLGIHDYHAGHVIGEHVDLKLSDSDLRTAFKAIKVRTGAPGGQRDKSKRVIYGTLYGMTALGLHKTYPELFPDIRSADSNQQLLFELCPKLPEWHTAIRNQAWEKGYLGGDDHPFHYKHWFWEVFKWDSRSGGFILGDDAKSCIAYYPQSTAAGVIYEACLELTDPEAATCIVEEAHPFRALVHDSMLLEVEQARRDWTIERVLTAMTRPIEEQPMVGELAVLGDYLQIGAVAKVGPNWLEMKEIAA